jgi:hypothetical protein
VSGHGVRLYNQYLKKESISQRAGPEGLAGVAIGIVTDPGNQSMRE